MLFHLAIQASHMVLQSPPRGIERVVDGNVDVLVRVVLARLAIHRGLAARHCEIDAHAIDRALVMPPISRLQRHPAGAHAVRELR